MSQLTTSEKVLRTAKWAETMARWHIAFARGKRVVGSKTVPLTRRWQLVSFPGPNGRESRGVVDLLAIRKNHRKDDGVIRRGDFFDVVLIQIKGGGARNPTPVDVSRLRAVKRRYHADKVLLVHWREGKDTRWFQLASPLAKEPWKEIEDLRYVFA